MSERQCLCCGLIEGAFYAHYRGPVRLTDSKYGKQLCKRCRYNAYNRARSKIVRESKQAETQAAQDAQTGQMKMFEG
jgi:hypothetical protein